MDYLYIVDNCRPGLAYIYIPNGNIELQRGPYASNPATTRDLMRLHRILCTNRAILEEQISHGTIQYRLNLPGLVSEEIPDEHPYHPRHGEWKQEMYRSCIQNNTNMILHDVRAVHYEEPQFDDYYPDCSHIEMETIDHAILLRNHRNLNEEAFRN